MRCTKKKESFGCLFSVGQTVRGARIPFDIYSLKYFPVSFLLVVIMFLQFKKIWFNELVDQMLF
jgi:hypothetical protein